MRMQMDEPAQAEILGRRLVFFIVDRCPFTVNYSGKAGKGYWWCILPQAVLTPPKDVEHASPHADRELVTARVPQKTHGRMLSTHGILA